MHRIQRGRSHTGATKLSVLAVAKEAGVSDSLIYNHYPAFAAEIAVALGRSASKQREQKNQELKAEKLANKELRAEIKKADARIAKLASINEMLSAEIEILKARIASPNVVSLNDKR